MVGELLVHYSFDGLGGVSLRWWQGRHYAGDIARVVRIFRLKLIATGRTARVRKYRGLAAIGIDKRMERVGAVRFSPGGGIPVRRWLPQA